MFGSGTPTTYMDATYSGSYTWPGTLRYPLGSAPRPDRHGARSASEPLDRAPLLG